ncbi:MAG: gamma-glutamylcyclotransferase family protein [Anaerolineae bacterium]
MPIWAAGSSTERSDGGAASRQSSEDSLEQSHRRPPDDAGGQLLYFAYGSNMLVARLTERAASARAEGAARLRDHRLAWHKPGADGSGKCDIVPSPGDEVWGVLYTLSSEDKVTLDEIEGVGAGYELVQVAVERGDGRLAAAAYRATEVEDGAVPYAWYKALVVSGAREHGLPDDYVRQLEGTPAMRDTDDVRRMMNAALLLLRDEGAGG